MGILDEAIREHLELKRQHGADDTELKKLEDDAFGPPQRPGAADEPSDTVAEAPTEFMSQPDVGGVEAPEDATGEPSEERPARREPVADVQEAPRPAPEEQPAPPEADEGPEADEEPEAQEESAPAAEEEPAGEHEIPPPPASHSTEEREIIADQPTQMFDVEKEFDSAPGAADPSDEELVAEEAAEPRLGPAEPAGTIDGGDEVEDDDDAFFDAQRLSDELDQALEAPLQEEPVSEEFEPEAEGEEPVSEEVEVEHSAAREGDDDVLEETPDFLEDAPEDEQLWFEQKPPKDFDFDD